MRRAGELSGQTVYDAVVKGFNKAQGATAAQMLTFRGQMTNVHDNIVFTLRDIGDSLLPFGKLFAETINNVLKSTRNMMEGIMKLPEPIKVFVVALGGIIVAIPIVITKCGELVFALGALGIALKLVAVWTGVAMLPLLLWGAVIVVAIATLATLAYWVHQHWDSIKAVTIQAAEGLKEAIPAIFGYIVNLLKVVFSPLLDMFDRTWKIIKFTLTAIWDEIVRVGKTMFGTFVEWLGPVFEPVKSAFRSVWEVIKVYLSSVWNQAQKDLTDFLARITLTVSVWASGFVHFLAAIPGMDKLLNLNETWDAQEKILNKATTAIVRKTDALKADQKAAEEETKKQQALDDAFKAATERYNYYANAHSQNLATSKQVRDAQIAMRKAEVAASDGELKMSYAGLDQVARIHAKKQELRKLDLEELGDRIKKQTDYNDSLRAESQLKAFNSGVTTGVFGDSAMDSANAIQKAGIRAASSIKNLDDALKLVNDAVDAPFKKIEDAYEKLGVDSSNTLNSRWMPPKPPTTSSKTSRRLPTIRNATRQ